MLNNNIILEWELFVTSTASVNCSLIMIVIEQNASKSCRRDGGGNGSGRGQGDGTALFLLNAVICSHFGRLRPEQISP